MSKTTACVQRALYVLLLILLAQRGEASTSQFMLVNAAVGQKSLLDLDDGEEEPLSEKPKKSGSKLPPSDVAEDEEPGEMPSLPPVVSEGIGGLDDLLGGESGKLKIETEQVCDLIRQSANGSSRIVKVKLLRRKLKLPLSRGQKIQVTRIDASGHRPFPMSIPSGTIASVSYYEERMLRRVAAELAEPVTVITRFDSFLDLGHPERMNRAKRGIALLTIAIGEHDSACARLQREGEAWDEFRFQLAQALFRLEISRVKLHFDGGQTQQAIAACDRLLQQRQLGAGPRKLIWRLFDEMLLAPAVDAARTGDHVRARDALNAFVERYPSQPSSRSNQIRETLGAAAQKVVDRAVADKNPKLLDTAAQIWPHVESLEELRSQMLQEYPVLYCAYGTLPKSFSPLSARTPVERHATGLLFESLVRWQDGAKAGSHYVSDLARTRPLPLARGREFRLPRTHWSDSDVATPHYCTTEDVLWTVRLMKKTKPSGFSLAWSRLVKDVTAAESRVSDPFRVSIFLENDHWQPLSLMDFPILPKSSFPSCGESDEELTSFEEQPVGTGPYVLRDAGGDGKSVRFVANPFYRNHGRPYVREIQFHQMAAIEARDAFLRGDVHLIHDVSPTHVVELIGQGEKVVKLPTRSIHFLAPNHRRPQLRNTDLRLAIAHAIEREKILDANYRPGSARNDHAALNGPFPTRSWAFNGDVPEYSSGSAATFVTKAKQKLGSIPKLRLVYPDRNQETGQACAEIKRQLEAVGIGIELQPVEPNAFVQRIVEQHNYDLAYWRHDFKDETYWLWPMLNPSDAESGGSNFMGYIPDPQLRDLFSRVLDHKMFRTIRDATHEIHEYLSKEAVVIPLWELDTYVAISKDVEDTKFSARSLFEDVESWKLRVPTP